MKWGCLYPHWLFYLTVLGGKKERRASVFDVVAGGERRGSGSGSTGPVSTGALRQNLKLKKSEGTTMCYAEIDLNWFWGQTWFIYCDRFSTFHICQTHSSK